MPKIPPHRLGVLGWIIQTAIVLGFAYLCWAYPAWLVVSLVVAVLACAQAILQRPRLRRIATERRSESISGFARSFNCRTTDTWIIRAVYEELTSYVQFPVRHDDRLEEDLRLDWEEIYEIATAIAQRTGRPLVNCEANPRYGNLTIARDLVDFFVHQPRRDRAAA
jgi:hypothetical protein